MPRHPNEALFEGQKPFPIIASCEHYAGTEQRITRALELQAEKNGIFDVSMDCEDGAPTGAERDHAEMVARMLNSDLNKFNQAGARIHDYTNEHWKNDVDIIVGQAGARVAYLTLPKATKASQLAEMIDYIRNVSAKSAGGREIPVHALIETHNGLRECWEIAALPNVRVLDFGMMDFVSDHHGALPSYVMKSPWQFDNKILQRAKAEMVAAAIANSVVPSHNVTLELRDEDFIYNDARRARHEFGFLRQWSIYPAQIDPIVRGMSIDVSELEDACAIVLKAYNADWGPIQHEGNLHDRATFRYFWEVIQRARLQGETLPDDVVSTFFSEPVGAA